jgi:hypothetical protein
MSIQSSIELNDITSLESNSFMANGNQFFSSSEEKNYILNSNSSELNESFTSEKISLLELKSSVINASSSKENNNITDTDSSPIKNASSLDKNIFFNLSSSPSPNKTHLKKSSNFNEDTREIKYIEISNSFTKKRKHNKFEKDNIKRTIQVNYLKFLIVFINQIIKVFVNSDKNQFYWLDSKFTKDISKKAFNEIKKKTIGEIFKDNASSKYKNNKKLNVQVYNKVTRKNKIIKEILDKPYLYFFYIYYSGQKTINLSDYGFDLDKTIDLSSETGFCKDLITKNNDTDTLERIYRTKILECIKKHFLTVNVPIFLTSKH